MKSVRVSRFQSFLVSRFQSFLVLKSQSFKDAKTSNILWKISIPYYQISMSCFLADTDPIFKIFKNLLDGSSGWHVSFPACSTCSTHLIFSKWYLGKVIWEFSLGDFKSILVSPKINNMGFGSHGHVRKARYHENGGGTNAQFFLDLL